MCVGLLSLAFFFSCAQTRDKDTFIFRGISFDIDFFSLSVLREGFETTEQGSEKGVCMCVCVWGTKKRGFAAAGELSRIFENLKFRIF